MIDIREMMVKTEMKEKKDQLDHQDLQEMLPVTKL